MHASVYELIMMILFGASWPLSLLQQVRAKTSRGKSLFFYAVIMIAYISGILNKLINGVDYVLVVYLINFAMVIAGFVMTLYYRRRDKQLDDALKAQEAKQVCE